MTETERDMPMVRRVLVLHPDIYLFGGAELLCVRVLALLQYRFSEVFVLHTGGPLDVDRIQNWCGITLDPTRVRFETAPWPFGLRRLKRKPILLSHAIVIRAARRRHRRNDLIMSTGGECPVLAGPFPTIQFIHFPIFFFDREAFAYQGAANLVMGQYVIRAAYVLLSRLLAGWQRQIVRSQITIANSEWTAAQFAQRYGSDNVVSLHFGTDVSLEPGHPDWLPFAERCNDFVTIGRVVPGKRLEDAIEIVGRLRRRGHKVGLHIIGTGQGPYADCIQQLIAGKPWVSWDAGLGRDAMERAAIRHKWGLHCYRFEHYGISVAELQRFGCVVFVHDSGGQREVIINPNQRYQTVEDAVDKIDKILNAETQHATLHARALQDSEAHTCGAFEQKFLALLDNILSAPAAALAREYQTI
jgi:glycosyltransferase involved in cell wall biosynthesis